MAKMVEGKWRIVFRKTSVMKRKSPDNLNLIKEMWRLVIVMKMR